MTAPSTPPARHEGPRPAWADEPALVGAQRRVGALEPARWTPPPRPILVGACFVAFDRGEQGPGRTGDHARVGAVLVDEQGAVRGGLVRRGRADGPYRPGLLGLREGGMSEAALRELIGRGPVPDVLMVDATGRDHPRRCGLAVHLGWALGIPSVGVTHRLLTAREVAPPPGPFVRGAVTPIPLDGRAAAWVVTAAGARPVVVHAGWRTDLESAVAVVLRTSGAARTPEPLRRARELARTARAEAERR